MTDRYRMFASFNRWANERIYAKAAELTDAEYRADRGAFFKSVHGTLNHLLVGDRIWMHRFDGAGDYPTKLDAILFDRLADLQARGAPRMSASRAMCRGSTGRSLRALLPTGLSSIQKRSPSRSRRR